MRLDEYIEDFHNYLIEIKFAYSSDSSDIKKIDRGRYAFSVEENDYVFRASPITIKDGRKGFTIEWGLLSNGSLSAEITGNRKIKIRVFRNVLSCLARFIEEEKPEVFSMYVSDKLVHIYDAMWAGHYKDKPFNLYSKDEKKYVMSGGRKLYAHYFTRKTEDDISESDKYRMIWH